MRLDDVSETILYACRTGACPQTRGIHDAMQLKLSLPQESLAPPGKAVVQEVILLVAVVGLLRRPPGHSSILTKARLSEQVTS